MEFANETAEIFVPDGLAAESALKRTTTMAVSAHQDDIEIFAYNPIVNAFGNPNDWFTAVVMTNGSGSARSGVYADYSDEKMQEIRRNEQKKAAVIGEYSAATLLDYSSAVLKDSTRKEPVADLVALLKAARPGIVYTHNLADKHDTHVAVTLRLLEALRQLDPEQRPEQVLGCEVWRDLDWMVDNDKVALRVDQHENLANALLGVFDSQIAGGKRYDLATAGRRRAHATYHESHDIDATEGFTFTMDLTPLINDPEQAPIDYVKGYIKRFSDDVTERISKLSR